MFQLNILALSGYYGRSVKDLAEFLLNNGYYDLVGTDLHGFQHLEALQYAEMTAPLRKLIESGQISNSSL